MALAVMEPYATDGKHTNAAGIPNYGICGIQLNDNNHRAHGRDEDLPIPAFDKGAEFYYRYLKMLSGGA